MATFTMDTYQSDALPSGASRVDAIVTVTASDLSSPGMSTQLGSDVPAELIIIDASGSMSGDKIRKTRAAAGVAVDGLREGTRFAIIAGNDEARMVFPPTETLATADAASRQEAKRALKNCRAGGGTKIGTWLILASRLLWYEDGIRHAILLTDGRNQSESASGLDEVLAYCRGVFQCDCRGVGTDWEVAELRKIADALLGTVDIVADPKGLAADFARITETAMSKRVASVVLRIWTPKDAAIEFVKQVYPSMLELVGNEVDGRPLETDFATGAWANEARDYHLRVRLAPAPTDDEMLAARVTLLVDGEAVGKRQVVATWTDDVELSTRISPKIAHYTGQAELVEAVQGGLAARAAGDDDTARMRFGRAVQIADATGAEETGKLLRQLVEVEDASTGRVRLKTTATIEDQFTLDTRSTRTQRVKQ